MMVHERRHGRASRARRAARRRTGSAWAAALTVLLGSGAAFSQPVPSAPAPGAPVPGAPAPAPTATAPGPVPAGADPSAPGPSAEGGPQTTTTTRGYQARRKVPPPPDPTPEQLAALAELQKEAEAYERDARDYRRTITRIIRHHYEERRRRVLSTLDREIEAELKGLDDARAEAIRRLELFVAKYSGQNAHPERSPDAMFRLAALYEERSREGYDMLSGGPPPDLVEAIALYKRIIGEFPEYSELAGVFYYLGHALNDAGRIVEAQQVWRSLVCHNHFPYPVPADPSDPGKDSIVRLPQDHEPDWWYGWMQRHPEPMDRLRAKHGERGPARPAASGREAPEIVADEDAFRDPYPTTCEAVPRKPEPGEEPRYLAEIWWKIGDYHFDEIDSYGGPFNLNRADSAYRQSLRYDKPPVHGVAMYKLAWTFFKQQRYKTAVEHFVKLLEYTDAREKETGNPGADFRTEAYSYIAGSVTYIDFEGPAGHDPYIARNDVFDLETDASIIEEKMHVAIDRVSDPALVPQDKPWTVEVYKALAYEYKEYNQYHNLVELNELILAKWPMHRDAPFVQNQIAEVYEQLAGQSRKGTAEYDGYLDKALKARGKLVFYVATPDDTPPWVEANKEDPEAIRAAEQLVRGGLRRAAADHTNGARRLVAEALRSTDAAEQRELFDRALGEYELAARSWGGYLHQDENAEDAYESRYWLADAYTNVVVIKVALGGLPEQHEVDRAMRAAREVRDSNEDDKYLQPAGLMVVKVAHQLALAKYKAFRKSGGAEGLEERTELKIEGSGKDARYVTDPVPAELRSLIEAWDEYIDRVPPEADPYKNHDQFAYNAGEVPFLYGQFEEAKKRLYPIYLAQCGKTEFGFMAWKKLITMANQDRDFEEGRKLAEAAKGTSCALSEKDKIEQAGIADPTLERGYYQDAAAAYKEAKAMADGPERTKMWRKAAALYQSALEKAPSNDAAPEAAMLGASAFKQVGEYDQAIGMYQLFIDEYGKPVLLDELKADARRQAEYQERVKFLKLAYDELAKARVLFFDYRGAAATYDQIANVSRFAAEDRKKAAQNAVVLYANIGERGKMTAAQSAFYGMGATEAQKAEIDWLVASADLKSWDARGMDRGANKSARLQAQSTLQAFYGKSKGSAQAAPFTVRAAYHLAKLYRAGNDKGQAGSWCDKAISAFDTYKAGAPVVEGTNKALGSEEADMAAECDYLAIDAELKDRWDYDAGHHRYAGVVSDVLDAFKDDAETKAKTYNDRLEVVIKKYGSPRWAVAARARQGSLYDSVRTGLYNTRPPGLLMYSKEEDKILKELDKLCVEEGNDKACTQHDAFTAKRVTDWRDKRDQYLAKADRAMVEGYAEAIMWAKVWSVSVPAVDDAIARLAFFTDILGDPKLREYSQNLKNPRTREPFVYTDGMFPQRRRGMVVEEEPRVLPAPLPAGM